MKKGLILFLSVLFIWSCKTTDSTIRSLSNQVGQPLTGNNYEGCDTLTHEKVFYDIINSDVCNCYSVDGGVLVERSCDNVVPGACGSTIKDICKCDDILGDSTEIVSYVEFFNIYSTGYSESIGTFTDKSMSTPYTPINTVDCFMGQDAEIVWERVVLENGTFTSDPITTALSYSIETLGGGVTIDDGTNSFPAYEGEHGHWGDDDYNIFSNTITITASNAVVVILYKKLN